MNWIDQFENSKIQIVFKYSFSLKTNLLIIIIKKRIKGKLDAVFRNNPEPPKQKKPKSLHPLPYLPNSAVSDSPPQLCPTTTWRLKIWSGTTNFRPSPTLAPAATCSRSPRRILSSVKRLLVALAALFTSPSSTTWKIFSITPIRRITKDLSPLNNTLSQSLNTYFRLLTRFNLRI